MNYDQRRTHAQVQKHLSRVEAALETMPTLEAANYRIQLRERLQETRDAISESLVADSALPRAKAVLNKAEKSLLAMTNAASIIVSASKVELAASTQLSAQTTRLGLSRDLLDALKPIAHFAVVAEALEAAWQKFEDAMEKENLASRAQRKAESKVYEANGALYFAIQEASTYIKVTNDEDSVARQRLKLRRRSAKRRAMEEAAKLSGAADTTA